MADHLELGKTANKIRKSTVTTVHSAKSGHLGNSLSSTDIFTYLCSKKMNMGPKESQMSGRDRFIPSKSRMAPGYYSTFVRRGFSPMKDLKTLRHTSFCLQRHLGKKHIPGVDMSSGSLGQGTSIAIDMVLSIKSQVKGYQVYTSCGDGRLEEGQAWEAAMFAGFRRLDNLVVIVDNNGLQIDEIVDEVRSPYPTNKKSEAFQFHMISINDHNFGQVGKAFEEARQAKGRPAAIIAKILKGKGISFMEGSVSRHGVVPNDRQYVAVMEEFEEVREALCQG